MPLPRSAADRSWPVRGVLAVLSAGGSLWLAVPLLAVIVAVLGLGTLVWKWYGESAAQFGVYGAWWFTLLGAALWLNVFCALLSRLPWKRRQAGFVIAHLGLLVLLAGCLLSRRAGVEATLAAFEGQTTALAYKDTQQAELNGQQLFELQIAPREGEGAEQSEAVPFTSGPFNWEDYRWLPWFPWRLAQRDRGTLYDRDGVRLEVLDYYSNARPRTVPRLEVQATPLAGQSQDENRGPVLLSVQPPEGPHAAGHPYGIGMRREIGGRRLVFYMTGSPGETEAFRNSKPVGELGKRGRLVLWTGGQTFQLPLDGWKPGTRRPLGKSGLEVELASLDEQLFTAKLLVHRTKGTVPFSGRRSASLPENRDSPHSAAAPPHDMLLSAEFPEFADRQDYEDGVFGAYWSDTKKTGQGDHAGPHRIRDAGAPRIEILQGADQKLYMRTWRAGQLEITGPLASDARVMAFENTPDATALAIESFVPSPRPEVVPEPLPLDGSKASRRQRYARLRLTVDETSEEFWLAGSSHDPLEKAAAAPMNARKVVSGGSRRVAVTLQPYCFTLGLAVHLKKAVRKLDPGTKQPSYYASHVDFVPGDGANRTKPLAADVLVSLNAPVDFHDPRSGRSYRLFQTGMQGPYSPEEIETSAAQPVYISYLSVNSDPGRGLIYTGCLLVVIGIFTRYYTRKKTA
jgi:hypothetical protein